MHSQRGQFSSGQTKPAWRGLILGCNTGQIEQRTCLVLVVLSRRPTRSSGLLGGCSDLRIRMKKNNIHVDATENSKEHYNCSKNCKHLHITWNENNKLLVLKVHTVVLQWCGLVTSQCLVHWKNWLGCIWNLATMTKHQWNLWQLPDGEKK